MNTSLLPAILTSAILTGSLLTSSAEIEATVNVGATISPKQNSHSISFTAAKGDVVVLIASTNKKSSAGSILFTTSPEIQLTTVDTHQITGNDTNPNQWAVYATIQSPGTFTFSAAGKGNPTANWVAYVLHSKASLPIQLISTAATNPTGLKSGSITFKNSYQWEGARDASIIESRGSANGKLEPSTDLSTDKSGGNKFNLRSVGHTQLKGSKGFHTTHTLTHTGSRSDPSAKAHAAVLGLAFAETNTETSNDPDPAFAALLSLGNISLILQPRE